MRTEYGNMSIEDLGDYVERLTGKIFKIIPMQEEGSETLNTYVQSVAREIFGCYKKVMSGKDVLEAINMLNGIDLNNHKTMRSDIFAIIALIKRAEKSVK